MKPKLLVFAIILSISILSASADPGCCINPNLAVTCEAVTEHIDCCPPDAATEAYEDVIGPQNQIECLADWFFNSTLENPCSNMVDFPYAHYCEEGCCCEELVTGLPEFDQEKEILCNDDNQEWFSFTQVNDVCNETNCAEALDLIKEHGDTCEQPGGIGSCGTGDLVCNLVVVVTGETHDYPGRSICCNPGECAANVLINDEPVDQCQADLSEPFDINLQCLNGAWLPSNTFLQKTDICAQVTGFNLDGTGIINHLGQCENLLLCGDVLGDTNKLICCDVDECGLFKENAYSCELNNSNTNFSNTNYSCDSGQWVLVEPRINDTDGDGIFDDVDNCVNVSNENQSDIDEEGIGDVCDDDMDGDGIPNVAGEGLLQPGDNCPKINNTDQLNTDNDTMGDVCDPDDDNDEVLDEDDNCPLIENYDQANNEGDRFGDVCDPDDDNDRVPDDGDNSTVEGDKYCQISRKQLRGWNNDNDNAPLEIRQTPDWPCDDNCKWDPNPDQKDTDLDFIGDACDPINERETSAWGWAMGLMILALVIGLIVGFFASTITLAGLAVSIATFGVIGIAAGAVIGLAIYYLWPYLV